MRDLHAVVFGVGAFAQGTLRVLRENGARVGTYLTRDYAHYPPSLEGPTFSASDYPSPVPLLQQLGADFVVPMSIDWILQDWAAELVQNGPPIFSPVGEGMRLERERNFAYELCQRFGIPFPRSFVAGNRLEAEQILEKYPGAYVIKNPLCSPTSPVHTIVCETEGDTRAWLRRVNYAEGVFLQEYLGRREAGHIALVSGGELVPLVTNQEYKRAFDGNQGIVAGAPLGGIVERDPDDRYGLARQLLEPLLPWFREVGFHGPVQVTAALHNGRWHVLEYNVRLGVTSGPMILRMLENPVEVLWDVVNNRVPAPRFKPEARYGCSVTLAGYGYPYVQVRGPNLPVRVEGDFTCDVWWNRVDRERSGQLVATGHRIADVVAVRRSLEEAISDVYANIRKIRCLGSYYRLDIGRSLWPPGTE